MNKQRIWVTGASRGIGRETALQLAKNGHHVVLIARDLPRLEQVHAEISAKGGSSEVMVMDVTKPVNSGDCDVLINNAGTCTQEWFLDQPLESQRAEFETNFWGCVQMARAVLPGMLARGRGSIVSVSSLLGNIASPTTANYGATKAALESWSYALRRELAGSGVTTTIFVSPHTQTDAGAGANFNGVYSLPVTYTAGELVRAVERAPRKYIASPVYRLMLFFARLFPSFMEARVAATTPPRKSVDDEQLRAR